MVEGLVAEWFTLAAAADELVLLGGGSLLLGAAAVLLTCSLDDAWFVFGRILDSLPSGGVLKI